MLSGKTKVSLLSIVNDIQGKSQVQEGWGCGGEGIEEVGKRAFGGIQNR